MFSSERRNVQMIINMLNELQDDMLPPSFPRDDEVEEKLNQIKSCLYRINSGFDNAENTIQDLEEQLSQ